METERAQLCEQHIFKIGREKVKLYFSTLCVSYMSTREVLFIHLFIQRTLRCFPPKFYRLGNMQWYIKKDNIERSGLCVCVLLLF